MVLIRVRRSTTDPGVKTVQDKKTGRKGASEIPGRQAKEDRIGSCADTRVVGAGTAFEIVPKGFVRRGAKQLSRPCHVGYDAEPPP